MAEHRAQVVLGSPVGHHHDPVVAAGDQLERRLVGVHRPGVGDGLDRPPQRLLEPGFGRRDLDLVPAEEQAGPPIVTDRPSLVRAAEARNDRGGSAGLGPLGQQLRQVGAARGVRVDVDGDIDALGLRPLDPLECERHLSPVAPPGDRKVRDLQPAAAQARDRQRLIHRLEQMIAVVAHVDGEHAVVASHGPADRHELVEIGGHRRRIHQPGRDAGRAIVEAALDGGHQRRPLGAVERPGGLARDRDPQRHVPHEQHRVECQAGSLERTGVARRVGPVPGLRGVRIDRRDRRPRQPGDGRGEWEGAHPAVAVDLGGDTLGDLAARPAVAQQREVRVAVDVDEAGRDDGSGRLDALRAACLDM